MAGGRFDRAVGKVRPGVYINFQSTRKTSLGTTDRGTVVIPFIGHDYGPEKEFITITNTAPDAAADKLGHYINDDNANMLLAREALKRSSTVVVYITKTGDKAQGTGGNLKGTAKYGGTRGNSLTFAIVANPVAGFDITVALAGETVSKYEGVTTLAEAVALNDPYITFTAVADAENISATAGVTLSGGTNGTASNGDVTAFLDAIERVNFDALCFPVTDDTLKQAAVAKIKYFRENIGKSVVAVLANKAADYEGVINVTNSVKVDGKELTTEQATAWVAGASAGATYAESNTYKAYDGATAVVNAKTHEQSVAAIQNGELFFSYAEDGSVVVEYDINSLVNIPDGKDTSYRKNRVVRVFDEFARSIQAAFPPNKYANNGDGWEIMEGVGRSILKTFEDNGAIKNVDYDADFSVEREASIGDQTYFKVGLEPLESAEKLYFTVSTR